MKSFQKASLFIIFILTVMVNIASARPPKNLELTYDLESKLLHIELDHIVDDRNEDYIRKLIIQKNEEEPLIKYYRSQTNMRKFIKDIEIDAEVDDVIQVKALSSEGGSASGSLTIIEDQEENDSLEDSASTEPTKQENGSDLPEDESNY